jgi:hypothetical protein
MSEILVADELELHRVPFAGTDDASPWRLETTLGEHGESSEPWVSAELSSTYSAAGFHANPITKRGDASHDWQQADRAFAQQLVQSLATRDRLGLCKHDIVGMIAHQCCTGELAGTLCAVQRDVSYE